MEVPTTQEQLWTSLSLITWGERTLASRQVDSPRLTSELLLTHVLQCRRIDLYTKYDRPVSAEELERFAQLCNRRLTGEPLQYIMGETEFMGLIFGVNPRVLIPRPETEVLVEEAVALAKSLRPAFILDIGTGSGNIAASLAKFIEGATIDAVDLSPEALDVARRNVERNGCEQRVRLFQRDVLQEDVSFPRTQYGMIVSNPPYISQAEYRLLPPEVSMFEPMMATTDGANGLTFFGALANLGARYLCPGGWMLVEHAYDQEHAVKSLFEQAGYCELATIVDYNKIPRVMKARWGV